jgi:hypothetical protein
MEVDVLTQNPPVPFASSYVLPNNVSAIQVVSAEDGEPTRLGLITRLPEGAEIHVGGPGFSEGTVKVICQGAAYFIFLDDLQLGRKGAAAFAYA